MRRRVRSHLPSVTSAVMAEIIRAQGSPGIARCVRAVEDALDREPPPVRPALVVAMEHDGGRVEIGAAPIAPFWIAWWRLYGVDLRAAEQIRREKGADAILVAIDTDGEVMLAAFDIDRQGGRCNAPGGAA